MEGQPQVFGSGELNGERIRSVQFSVGPNGYAPDEVHAFLGQVASAVDVLLSEPGPSAVRAELMRVQETTANMVLASQQAAERLRETGAEDARSLVEDAKLLAEQLRDRADQEFSGARVHVETLRTQFIQEMRDMYDRIGATLYRFEHADPQQAAAQAPVPSAAPEPAVAAEPVHVAEPTPVEEPPQAPQVEAPQEPLVDLREMQADPHVPVTTSAEFEPAPPQPAVEEQPLAAPDFAPATPEPVEDDGGGWLIGPDEGAAPTGYVDGGDSLAAASAARLPDEPTPQVEATFEPAAPMQASIDPDDPQAIADNARAEALLAGMDAVVANAATPTEPLAPTDPPPLPDPPSLTPQEHAAPQPDPAAIKSFVLQSLAEGSPREAIESYLRTTLGLADPTGTVDAILAEAQG